MHWKDTVLKSKEIKWVRPRIKNIEDGKLDVNLNIPLTQLIEGQAKLSFTHGVVQALNFTADYQRNKRTIKTQDLLGFLNGCGLPELVDKIKSEEP